MTVLSAVESSLVLADAPELRTLRVRGKDAASWLNGLVTCDTTAVDAKRGAHGLLLTKQGKIITELLLVRDGDTLLLGLGEAQIESVSALLDRYLVMEDAELEPAPELAWARLLGPSANSARIEGKLARGSIDWLRVEGAALVATKAELGRVGDELVRAGAIRATAAEWDLLRIAHAFPAFGVDYGSDDNPHEASLERRSVSWTKGCYLGQEVVCMQDMRGRVKRRSVGLELAGSAPTVGAEVRVTGEAESVGTVTSSAGDGARGFCIARLRAPFFDGSRELEVEGRPARIVAPKSAG